MKARPHLCTALRAALFVFIAATVTATALGTLCAQQRSARDILIGSPPPAKAPKLPLKGWGERVERWDAHEAWGGDDWDEEDIAPKAPPTPRKLYVVADTPYESWGDQGSYVHVAVYNAAFRPVSGASVYLDEAMVGKTDGTGTLVFRYTPEGSGADRGRAGTLRAITGKPGTRNAAWGAVEFEAYLRTPSFESTRLYAYTDRAVYSPGQPIRVRALAWSLRGDYTPLGDTPVTLQLIDGRGELLTGAKVPTDDYGIAALDLPLPEATPEGVYTLAIAYKGARETTSLRIERIAKPDVAIDHTLGRFVTFDAAKLGFDVRLTALSGRPMRQGKLHAKLIARGQTLWDQTQPFAAAHAYRFEVPDDALKKLQGMLRDGERFEVHLTAAPKEGRADTLKRSIRISRLPWVAVIEPDRDIYAPNDTATVQVKLVDLDDVPGTGKQITLRLVHMDKPARTLKARTSAEGVAVFTVPLKAWGVRSGDWVDLDASVEGARKSLGAASLEIGEPRPMRSKLAKSVVREGQRVPITVTLEPGFVPTERVVHADVVDSSGALIHAMTLPIRRQGARYVASGAFEAPAWGTMLLTLFCAARDTRAAFGYRAVGLVTEGHQLTVTPNKALSITLDGVPDVAAPGQALDVRVKVQDARGRPADARFGAALVDGGVLALQDPMEVAPSARFYNPELKVLSNTGSKILTWPVVTRNWGDMRYDVALPPFGFLPGDPPPQRGGRRGGWGAGGGVVKSAGGMIGWGSIGSGVGSAASVKPMVLSAKKSAAKPSKTKSIDFEGVKVEGALVKPDGALLAARGAKRAEGKARRRPQAPKTTITLRTRFPETGLWLPREEARGGQGRFRVELPDAITEQVLTVVASDKVGGVGMARSRVKVREPFSVALQPPAEAAMGETQEVAVWVSNREATPQRVAVSWEALPLMEVVGADRAPEIVMPPGATRMFTARLRATRPGRARVCARASRSGGTRQHVACHPVWVQPAGTRSVERAEGRASAKTPFRASVQLKPGEHAMLRVVYPGASGLAEHFEVLKASDAKTLPVLGDRIVMAHHIQRALAAQGLLTDAHRRELRQVMLDEVGLIAMFDLPRSGTTPPALAWALPFVAPRGPDVYLLARVLDGLNAAREADILIPDAAIAKLTQSILSTIGPDGLSADVGRTRWDGDTQAYRRSVTMQLFRAVAEAGPKAVPEPSQAALARLLKAAQTEARSGRDPLAVAHAALGLIAYARRFDPKALTPADRRLFAERLVALRRHAHWEPSWTHAAGGRLEATAAALELAAHLRDQPAAQPLLNEAADMLIGARTSGLFGHWHNGPGSLAMVRAMAALPPTPRERGGASARIVIDGRAIKTLTLDPKDPFGSALALASVDLGAHLTSGAAHTVEVHVEGAIAPLVALETVRYGVSAVRGATSTR